eukprot:3547481-Amphidinium_carterae.1
MVCPMTREELDSGGTRAVLIWSASLLLQLPLVQISSAIARESHFMRFVSVASLPRLLSLRSVHQVQVRQAKHTPLFGWRDDFAFKVSQNEWRNSKPTLSTLADSS